VQDVQPDEASVEEPITCHIANRYWFSIVPFVKPHPAALFRHRLAEQHPARVAEWTEGSLWVEPAARSRKCPLTGRVSDAGPARVVDR